MSRLVICDSLLLIWRDNLILALQATDNTVYRSQKILLTNAIFVVACSNQSRLVADIRNICAREARGLLGEEITIQILIQLQLAEMHLENLFALVQLGQTHLNLAVETTCTHQRLIQNVGTVCSSQHNHSCICLEAIHLGKQLIESVFTLIIAREAGILTSCTTDCINLIDKDDARSLLLCLVEQISHTRGADTHKHLHEVRARNREEWYIRLAGNSLCQQSLTRSRRTYQECALRNLCSELTIFRGIFQEVDNLHNLDLRLLQACYILECHTLIRVALIELLRTSLSDIHNAATCATATSGHTSHNKEPNSNHHNPRQQPHKPRVVPRLLVLEGQNYALTTLLLCLLQIGLERIYRADIEIELMTALGQLLVADIALSQRLGFTLFEFNTSLVTIYHHNLLDIARLDQAFDGCPIGLHGSKLLVAKNPIADNNERYRTPQPHNIGAWHIDISLVFCHK